MVFYLYIAASRERESFLGLLSYLRVPEWRRNRCWRYSGFGGRSESGLEVFCPVTLQGSDPLKQLERPPAEDSPKFFGIQSSAPRVHHRRHQKPPFLPIAIVRFNVCGLPKTLTKKLYQHQHQQLVSAVRCSQSISSVEG